MSSTMPGIGSVVVLHQSNGSSYVDVPALVACTYDAWGANPQFANLYGTQPAANEAILVAFTGGTVFGNVTATEGTGIGQFSRVSEVLNEVIVPDI